LEEILNWGSLPNIANTKDAILKSEILRSYVEVYLREEIREEQIIRRLDPFARFLECAGQSSGEIINHAKIGREAFSDSKSIMRYFQILEDTLLGFYLEPYHKSVRKRQRQQAKFYLFDLGVKRALEESLMSPLKKGTYGWGKAFEHFIVLECIRLNSYYRCGYRFSYLKTQNQLEVDLIIERKGSPTFVVEIKSSESPDITEVNKLIELAKDISESIPVVLCTAKEERIQKGVSILPWQIGLQKIFYPTENKEQQ
jgi:uncharacterized protein